jgi:hypothetical protein
VSDGADGGEVVGGVTAAGVGRGLGGVQSSSKIVLADVNVVAISRITVAFFANA